MGLFLKNHILMNPAFIILLIHFQKGFYMKYTYSTEKIPIQQWVVYLVQKTKNDMACFNGAHTHKK